jgi:hypothetical protein
MVSHAEVLAHNNVAQRLDRDILAPFEVNAGVEIG